MSLCQGDAGTETLKSKRTLN